MPNDLLIYEIFDIPGLVEQGILRHLGGQRYQFTKTFLHDPVIFPKPLLRPKWKIHLSDIWKAETGAIIKVLDISGPAPTVQRPGQQAFTFQFEFGDSYAAYAGDARIIADNAPVEPVVDTGPDIVVPSGAKVTLVATLNNPKFQPMPFNWIQTAGPVVTLSDVRSLEPTFTAPVVTVQTTLTFVFVAQGGEKFSDTVNVIVNP